jgi:hypothetical protein
MPAMRFKAGLTVALLACAAACTSAPDKRWLKPGPYTTEEFRRDAVSCTKGRTLDEDCMQAKGWVTVNPDKPEQVKPKKADPYERRY